MKSFLFRMLCFFVPVIIIAFVSDDFITNNLRKSPYGDYAVWNDLLQGKVKDEIMIYGSSRANVHINPKLVEDSTGMSAYNFGIQGHNFYMTYLRHQLLLKSGHTPKVIIMSLDYFTLSKRKDLYNYSQFLPYLDIKEIKDAVNTYDGLKLSDYYLPLVKYSGQNISILQALKIWINFKRHTPVKPDRYKGFMGQDLPWNNDLERAKSANRDYVQQLDSSSVALFEVFLRDCKRRDVKLILVYSPEYIEGQQFVKNRGQIFSLYRSFSERYDIPFYDYSGDSISYQKTLFYNSQHLNFKGANLFTAALIHRIKCENL